MTRSRIARAKNILISDIKHDSTCISLSLPYSLMCANCDKKSDPLMNHRKTKNTAKKERHKSARSRCQQYWQLKWSKNSTGYLAKHSLVHNY